MDTNLLTVALNSKFELLEAKRSIEGSKRSDLRVTISVVLDKRYYVKYMDENNAIILQETNSNAILKVLKNSSDYENLSMQIIANEFIIPLKWVEESREEKQIPKSDPKGIFS